MVQVGGIGAARGGVAARRRTAQGAGGFTVGGYQAAPEGAQALSASTAVGDLGGMLTLQEMPSDAERNRRAAAHGAEIMTVLSALQRALLGSGEDPAALARLVKLADSAPEPADPRLAGLMSAILLRAKVELARRLVPKN